MPLVDVQQHALLRLKAHSSVFLFGCLSAVMDHVDVREERCSLAPERDPSKQIDFLVVHEVALVESTNRSEEIEGHGKKGAQKNVDRPVPIVVPADLGNTDSNGLVVRLECLSSQKAIRASKESNKTKRRR